MPRTQMRRTQTPLTEHFAFLWREIVAVERAELYASPERCEEIERLQPERESRGRAILYFPTSRSEPIPSTIKIRFPDTALDTLSTELEEEAEEMQVAA